MQKLIAANGVLIPYHLKRSKRAKYLRLTVHPDLRVVVTLPYFMNENKVEPFIKQKANWVAKSLEEYKKFNGTNIIWGGLPEFRKYKDKARELARQKVAEFNQHYKFEFKNIFIKNYKRSWGSCSEKRNLNFHFKIVHLPERLLDYIIVHELCHLQEFNHSPAFWGLVSKQIPEHKAARKELRSVAI
ncbi:MAG: hypothetical protein COT81_03165 [Candidatus Buchananbacteria bacterium CG10_big_fil_rev_8_21_14_0_10_42_9]|uniref:YgjP-like metallopeptidase domain-containing protein n=1 Tax=Candidatus Buchananbacteria bacterium CG10_big_fil_rev_8_21_14_0_10_42_9 TaxID=1974526 RepID=A0A2H0W302_9BACT|nr:MAG: hypothetical protein COT81_03165 [Candidatus Buchananbacteria bacterium CG10_big_fil_rev_8_21_14_0_10_42_9]